MPSENYVNKSSTSTRVGNWGGRLEKRAKSTKVKDCAAETETLTVGLLYVYVFCDSCQT